MATLILLLLLAPARMQQPPPPQPPVVPRDPALAVRATGTAVIRGRVTDRDTGQPIPRAVVALVSSGAARQPGSPPPEAQTASDGRYEFRGLPAGEYAVVVRPGEFRVSHLPHAFGGDRPANFARMGMPRTSFSLADGEVRENVDVALWRALAIEGRVVDEFGEPMAGVEVSALIAGTGQRLPTSGPYQFSSDDRGLFRIYGVAPGRYTVCASPRNFVASPFAEVRERHIRTCHPSAVIDADAQEITVADADIGGIEIRVQRSRTFTVSGMALDSSGAPLQRGELSVMRLERSGSSGTGVDLQPNGEFVARGLIPGDYAIQARVPSMGNPDDKRERELASVPFRIDSSNVEGLLVVTRKATRVSGRMRFEDASAPTALDSLRVIASPDRSSRGMVMGPQPSAQLKPDLTFELSGLFGPTAIQAVGLPRDWIVKSIRYKAQDITDLPVDFAGARADDSLEIVLTIRAARVAGRVIDDQGNPAADARVVVLPADSARWKAPSAVRFAAVKPDGAFQSGPVRAGEYLVAAIDGDDAPPMPNEPEFLERIARVAQRITLVEDERLTLDVRVARLR
jgi:protocatechuate 3,4-dioxygenase beta subunit